MTPVKVQPTTGLDRTAVFLSGLCLLHCMAIPFALLLGPLLGPWLVNTESSVHWALLALAAPISAAALWRGLKRHHSRLTVALGGAGLLLMLLGVSHLFGETWEVLLTVVGVGLLLVAHVRNMLGSHHHA